MLATKEFELYISEIITGIVSFSIGAISVYLTAYSKEKGKNKALKEDLFELENQKQTIHSKFQSELELLKKQHALDAKKREFKYVDKRDQFAKYFALLEEFHGKSNAIVADKFQPIISDFLVAFMSGEQDKQDLAIKQFTDSNSIIFQELNHDLVKLKTETHGLRLISSDELEVLLDELDASITKSTNDATSMVQFMAKPEFWANQALLKPYEQQNIISAKEVEQVHLKVKRQMKAELDVI